MEDCAPRALVGITRIAAPPFKYNHTFAREKYAGEEDCWVLPHCATTNKTLLPDLPTAILSPMGNCNAKNTLYKTELCRNFEASGSCKYGAGCRFAHGTAQLRPLARHPKYKTAACLTFRKFGTCPYGDRCKFLHEAETEQLEVRPSFDDIKTPAQPQHAQFSPTPTNQKVELQCKD